MKLLPIAPDCGGCNRRELLLGAAAVTIVACTPGGDPGVDARIGGPDSSTGSGVTMCGAAVCIDLSNPSTAALGNVNGSLIVVAPTTSKRLILVRTSDTQVVALSDICTHAGCSVRYDATAMLLKCPCHGSQFDLTGGVVRGPATVPLKTFAVSIDTSTNTLTITLG